MRARSRSQDLCQGWRTLKERCAFEALPNDASGIFWKPERAGDDYQAEEKNRQEDKRRQVGAVRGRLRYEEQDKADQECDGQKNS
jgi:hypothetical protein